MDGGWVLGSAPSCLAATGDGYGHNLSCLENRDWRLSALQCLLSLQPAAPLTSQERQQIRSVKRPGREFRKNECGFDRIFKNTILLIWKRHERGNVRDG